MKSLFSVLIARNLVNLHTLSIKDCKEMIHVIGGDENEKNNITGQEGSITIFHKLKKMELCGLSKLTSVYKGNENIEFPILHELKIDRCPQLNKAASGTQDITIANHNLSPHLFCHQVSFTNLKKLTVKYDATSQMASCPQIPIEFLTRSLVELRIEKCDGMSSLFSCSTAANLINLRELEILNCAQMVALIEEEKEYSSHHNQTSLHLFPNLKKLRLLHLGELKIFSGCRRCALNNMAASLENLSIIGCPKMERLRLGFVSTPKQEERDDTLRGDQIRLNDAVSFNNLKTLFLWYVGCREIPIEFLTRSLEALYISRCDGMSSLFSCSTAANLINLRTLEIKYCGQMVEVIEEEKEYSSHHNQTTLHLFPNLKELSLGFLWELKIFSGCRRCALNMPSLEDVSIENCPKMERLSLGCVSFNNLKNLKLSNVGFREIPLGFSIRSLEELDIQYCGRMSSLFSCSTAANLINLRRLLIWNCGQMVEVIEEEKEYSSHHNQTTLLLFPNLNELKLSELRQLKIFSGCRRCALNNMAASLEHLSINGCPKLMERLRLGFVSTPKQEERDDTLRGDQIRLNDAVSFSNLKTLKLWNVGCREIPIEFLTRSLEELYILGCDGMSSLFSCSTAANLINLRTLEIWNCGLMVEVIEKEKEYSSHHNQTTLLLFPNLKRLYLMDMPELKIFSGCRRCALNMPLLGYAEINNCPNMERLSLGCLNTPNLKRVTIEGEIINMTGVKNFFTVTSLLYSLLMEIFSLGSLTTPNLEIAWISKRISITAENSSVIEGRRHG